VNTVLVWLAIIISVVALCCMTWIVWRLGRNPDVGTMAGDLADDAARLAAKDAAANEEREKEKAKEKIQAAQESAKDVTHESLSNRLRRMLGR
jgi:hypothetical protein